MKNVLNRHYIHVLFLIIPLAIFLKLGSLISEKAQMIDELQSRNEQLQGEYADIEKRVENSIAYQDKLNEELAGYMDSYQKLKESIESWKNESANEEQAFHGDWWIDSFYASEVDGKQKYVGYGQYIRFNRKYIFMTDDHITDEPIYAIVICDRDKILTELSDIGIDDIGITGMLDSDYYVEMDFSETYNWNRTMFPGEADFMQGAKYYPIDLYTMLCITRNDGGKVYVLKRHLAPTGRE